MDEEKNGAAQEKIEKDTFWIKVLITTIVVVWVSLVAGSWVGQYVANTKILGKQTAYNHKNGASEKPKSWKKSVNLDNQGNVTESEESDEPNSDIKVPDFRNIDNPIPGIDDQAIRTLGSGESNGVKKEATPPPLTDGAATPSPEVTPSPESSGTPADQTHQSTPEPRPSQSDRPDAVRTTATPAAVKTAVPEKPAPSPAAVRTTTPAKPAPSPAAVRTTAPAKPAPSPAAAKATPAAKASPAAAKPEKPAAGRSDKIDLQMGSFSNQQNAEKILGDLKQKGYSAKIEKVKDGDREFYKVKMDDKIDSRESATERADKLKKDGFDAIIITR